jgi:adenosine/AMP kinase
MEKVRRLRNSHTDDQNDAPITKGTEDDAEIEWRKGFLQQIGYKL